MSRAQAPANIRALRSIVATGQYGEAGGMTVDRTTAAAILAVYDALSKANRVRYASFGIARMADMAWKLTR